MRFRCAGMPVFKTAEEEGAFWDTHSTVDYPEYFIDDDEEILVCGKPIRKAGPMFDPRLGNLPFMFPLIPISNSEAPGSSACPADADVNTGTRTHQDTPEDTSR